MRDSELIDLDRTDRGRERDWGTFQRKEDKKETEQIEREKKQQQERERERRELT